MNKPTPQQLAILAAEPKAVLHFGGKRPVKKKSRPTVFFSDGARVEGQEAKYWCGGWYDWWEWEGTGGQDIIAYITDPDYPQPPQSIPDELGAQGQIGGLWGDEPHKERLTRQDAEDMLANAYASILHDCCGLLDPSNTNVKAILDAIAGEE
jgi:hypothetical protein